MTDTIDYEIVRSIDGVEVRRYPGIVLATVKGLPDDSAFSLLFNYISGYNAPSRKIPMTTPVISQEKGEKMAMTAPVISEQDTFSFVLPASYNADNAPDPLDPKVRIVGVPERLVAAVQFSGRAYAREVRDRQRELLEVLRRNNIPARGAPFLMRYNSPLTPGFLRRNEVGVEVDLD